MIFKLIDKSCYEKIAPLSLKLAELHAAQRPDLFQETKIMSKKEFIKRIKLKGFLGIAAYKNDMLCAYCFCRIKHFKSKQNPDTASLWIDEIFVKEEYRRNGVGTALFEEIKRIAKEKDCAIIEFDVWELNDAAKKFYDELGCKTQRTLKEYKL
ncbi:MAG: GNAT family N-acetyltransferase [Clostridia bacterium]|nr:GNAT family N-acetyltransferase [Clostridia bacterium]